MSRKLGGRSLTVVLAMAVAVVLLPALCSQAQAQQTCTAIRGIIQADLPSQYPIGPDNVNDWGGKVYAAVGGEILVGIMSGGGGAATQHGARGERYTMYLCSFAIPGALEYPPACPDSITHEVPNSVYGFAPGKGGLGDYMGNSARIISGTGRFQGASGNLNTAGPYILWPDSSSPFGVYAKWNGEFSGSVCGIQ